MLKLILELMQNPAFTAQVKYQVKKYPPNTTLLVEGQQHTDLYLIQQGMVRILVHGDVGKADLTAPIHPGVADLEAGDIFGEFILFEDSPASADVNTVTETELIEINANSLRAFMESNPAIGYRLLNDLFKIFVKRLCLANRSVVRLLEWGLKAHKLDQHL